MKKRWVLCLGLVFLSCFWGCEQRSSQKATSADLKVVNAKMEKPKSLSERKLNGPVLMYYDNGELKAERNYKDAKLDGAYRSYYEDGRLQVEGTYQDDKMDGVFRHYDRNGQLQSEEVYRDNILIDRKVVGQ